MKLQVIGIERKTGTYDNKDTGKSYPYDNFNLHCVGKNMKVHGQSVREVKLKVADAAELVAAVGGNSEQLVGRTVDFVFGSYGKVVSYEMVK